MTAVSAAVALNEDQLFLYHQFAAELLAYACDGTAGRDELDPIYQRIVEGRDGPTAKMRARYSSCADLAHWLYFRLGVRAKWINRAEHRGWVVGANLNRWCGKGIGPNPYGGAPSRKKDLDAIDAFMPGDVIVVSNVYGGHVLCVTAYEPRRQAVHVMHTAEYGQPGGKLRDHVVSADSGGVRIGGSRNPVISHVRMRDVLVGEAAAGRLASADVDVLAGWQAREALTAYRNQLVYKTP